MTDGSTAEMPAAPLRTGYTFGGWYTDPECKNAFDFATPVTDDMMLYARWIENPSAESVTVTLNVSDITLNVGEKLPLIAEITPDSAKGQPITWYSSDEDCAKVHGGTVVAVKPGTTVITAILEDGTYAECTVTIVDGSTDQGDGSKDNDGSDQGGGSKDNDGSDQGDGSKDNDGSDQGDGSKDNDGTDQGDGSKDCNGTDQGDGSKDNDGAKKDDGSNGNGRTDTNDEPGRGDGAAESPDQPGRGDGDGDGNDDGSGDGDLIVIKKPRSLTGIFGDVDRDTIITSNDALLSLRQSIGFEDFDEDLIYIGDIDDDTVVKSNDALADLRYSVGFRDGNKVGTPIK